MQDVINRSVRREIIISHCGEGRRSGKPYKNNDKNVNRRLKKKEESYET